NDEKKRAAFRDGEWNRYRVVCLGEWITTWVNGIRVADLTDDMTARGFIGLQVHSYRGEKPAQVRWRNIRLRELTPVKRSRRTAGEGEYRWRLGRG
ncbi:MAG: DUF1080 domain-containing protein, partial [Armatimonadota bacterium]